MKPFSEKKQARINKIICSIKENPTMTAEQIGVLLGEPAFIIKQQIEKLEKNEPKELIIIRDQDSGEKEFYDSKSDISLLAYNEVNDAKNTTEGVNPPKKDIQEYIKQNIDKMSYSQMAENLNVGISRIWGNLAAFRKEDIISPAPEVEEFLAINVKKDVVVIPEIKPFVGEYANYGGEKKKIARELILKYIKESGVLSGYILTLPAALCILEKMIMDIAESVFSFKGYETNLNTYKEMLQTIKSEECFNIHPNFGNINDAITSSKPDVYSHLLLDFCSTLQSNEETIKNALVGNIVKVNGIIMITLSLRLRKESEIVKKYADENSNEDKNISAILGFLSQFSNYKIIEKHKYCEDKTEFHPKGQTMFMVVLKRIEKTELKKIVRNPFKYNSNYA